MITKLGDGAIMGKTQFLFSRLCTYNELKDGLINLRIFSVCAPLPLSTLCTPQVTEHVPLHSKALCKNMARASGGANNMQPLSLWGGGGAQTEKIPI